MDILVNVRCLECRWWGKKRCFKCLYIHHNGNKFAIEFTRFESTLLKGEGDEGRG